MASFASPIRLLCLSKHTEAAFGRPASQRAILIAMSKLVTLRGRHEQYKVLALQFISGIAEE